MAPPAQDIRTSPLFRADVLHRVATNALTADTFPRAKHAAALGDDDAQLRLEAPERSTVQEAVRVLSAYASAAEREGLRTFEVQRLRYALCGCRILVGDMVQARIELEQLAKALRPPRRAGDMPPQELRERLALDEAVLGTLVKLTRPAAGGEHRGEQPHERYERWRKEIQVALQQGEV